MRGHIKQMVFRQPSIFISILLILLLFSSVSVLAGRFSVIEKDNKKGLINEKGDVIIPAEHDDLGWSNGRHDVVDNVIGFKKEGKWGLLNTKNQKIIDSEYLELFPYDESSLICSRIYFGDTTPRFGIISTKGKLLLEFKYDLLEKNADRLIVRIKDRNNIKYGLIDKEGRLYLSFSYKLVSALNDRLYAVTKDLFTFQLFDSGGKQLTNAVYDSIGLFSGEYATIYKNGRKGLIDSQGRVVVKPEYEDVKVEGNGEIQIKPFPRWELFDVGHQLRAKFSYQRVEPFDKMVYKVKTEQTEALVNINNENLTDFKQYNFLQLVDTLVSYEYLNKQGIMSVFGKEVIPPVYDSVFIDYPNVLLYIQTSSRQGWRLADIKGNIINQEPYDKINRLNDLLFKVKKGGYWGLLKKDGKEQVFCKYDSIEDFFEERLRVHFFGENGILDERGEWIILPQKQEIDLLKGHRFLIRSIYESEVAFFDGPQIFETKNFLYPHGENFLHKNLDNQYGLFRNDGMRLCPTIYDEISGLFEDSLYIAKKDTTHSFITKNGLTMNYLDPRFEEVRPMKEGFIGVKIDGKYGFVDPNGDLRIANRYEEIGDFNNGLAPVMILGKWGFVNVVENIVIQPRYQDAKGYENGIFVVKQDNKFGIIDNEGHTIVRTEYDSIKKIESGYFISKMNGKYGLINKFGQIMVLPRFDSLRDLKNGYLLVSRKDKFGLITTEGIDIFPIVYDEIIYDEINDLYIAKTNQNWRALH